MLPCAPLGYLNSTPEGMAPSRIPPLHCIPTYMYIKMYLSSECMYSYNEFLTFAVKTDSDPLVWKEDAFGGMMELRRQIIDSNCPRFSESPTNIILFPRSASSISFASNLHTLTYIYIWATYKTLIYVGSPRHHNAMQVGVWEDETVRGRMKSVIGLLELSSLISFFYLSAHFICLTYPPK